MAVLDRNAVGAIGCALDGRSALIPDGVSVCGATRTNPIVPGGLTDMAYADELIRRHVIVGSGSEALPGVTLANGVAA